MNPERLILERLSELHPHMLAENVLWSAMRMDVKNYSLTDLRAECRKLEAKGQILIVSNEDTTFIKITTGGLARLAE